MLCTNHDYINDYYNYLSFNDLEQIDRKITVVCVYP